MSIKYNFREGLSSTWASKNPVLGVSEPGVEIDTGKFKMGNGHTPWNDLPYYITEDEISAKIAAAIEGVESGESSPLLEAHVNSQTPHPVYDDGPSLLLRYRNAKV